MVRIGAVRFKPGMEPVFVTQRIATFSIENGIEVLAMFHFNEYHQQWCRE